MYTQGCFTISPGYNSKDRNGLDGMQQIYENINNITFTLVLSNNSDHLILHKRINFNYKLQLNEI